MSMICSPAAVESAWRWLCHSAYYASIDKTQLLRLLAKHVRCPILLDLLQQFMHYSVERGGLFHQPRCGIPRSCPLSPLRAGCHLYELDRDLASRKGVRYLRFMDDLLILSRTRWQLKRAVASMNRWLAEAGLAQHPDKTFIGRIARGFDWLGYQFGASGLISVAARAFEHFAINIHRLYEQARCRGVSTEETRQRVDEYGKRWRRWLTAGLPEGVGLDQINLATYASPCDTSTPAGMSVL